MRMSLRAGAAAAVAAASLFGATTASASTPTLAHPNSGSACSGNVCIYLSAPSGGKVYVQAWANTTTFTGYFRLTGPSGVAATNSSVGTWLAGGGNYYQFSNVTAATGLYCVAGYTSSGNTYQGAACTSN